MNRRAFIVGHLCLLSAAAFLVTGCHKDDFPAYASNYREFAYITNGGSNTVFIYDIVNLREDREVIVGEHPVAVAASAIRNEVYVVNSGNGTNNGSLTIIDTEKNQPVATIAVQRAPVALDIDDTAAIAYIANSGSNSISAVDLKTHREKYVMGVGEKPQAIQLTPDNKSLLVSNSLGNSITIFNTTDATAGQKPRAVFEGCPGAGNIVVLPDSSKAFAACTTGHQVLSIRLSDGKQPDRAEALMDVGKLPGFLALKPDGGEIFVMNAGSDTISELSTPTNDIGGSYLMGAHPQQGLVTADNSQLYVSNSGSNEVTIYAIDDGQRIGGVSVGDGPSAMALSSLGHLLLVVDTHSGDLALVRTASHALFNIVPTGSGPNSIAVKSFTVK